jgi:MerR family transcriptional regulator, light-induced transcriptional regulator
MSVIRTNAAAAMLGVSTNTLRSWERRFGYPMPRRTEGGHRQFEMAEIEALKQALQETHNISSAISIARERGQGMASPERLRGAFIAFDQQQADRVLEEGLALRSVERTVGALLLPAVEALAPGSTENRRSGLAQAQNRSNDLTAVPDSAEAGQGGSCAGSAEYGFAWRYATGWLAAAQRIAPPATREEGVLIFDASHPTDMDALHVQALELFLRRAGLRVLALPVELEPSRIGNALRALRPAAVVLSGQRASLDVLGRLVYAARQSGGEIEVLDFRGALPDTGASTVVRLGDSPEAAAVMLRERVASERVATHTRVRERVATANA